jgi:SAM-dependent methyltransferase
MGTAARWWRENAALEHLTPPGTRGAEGFDVHAALRDEIPSGTVLDFGCGDGRLAEAFGPERYLGVDINPHAIGYCQGKYRGWRFELAAAELPAADCALAYTVLLHVPDGELAATVRRLCAAAPRVLVAEILGRKWRGPGEPAVFNRDLDDYLLPFWRAGMALVAMRERPYARYGGVPITFMEFRRGSLRHAP